MVGATRRRHIEGAVKAVELELTPEEISWLEEPYVPHKLVGVMGAEYPGGSRRAARLEYRKSEDPGAVAKKDIVWDNSVGEVFLFIK